MAEAGGSTAAARPQAEPMGTVLGLSPDLTSTAFALPPSRHLPLVWAATAATGVLACATLVFNLLGAPGAWQGLPEPTPLTNERAEVDLPVLTTPVHSAIGRFQDEAGVRPDAPVAAPLPEVVPPAPMPSTSLSAQGPTSQAEVPVRADAPRPPAAALGFTGLWAPKGTACSPRDNRGGYLPAVITADGAFAGETSCAFRKTRPEGGGWVVVAACESPKGRWSSTVRLSVEGNRLTWSSARGTQVYVRCGNQRAEQVLGRGP